MKCLRCDGKGKYMREIGGYRPCEYCNGTGEVKQTNFQRITASPEALAEFIGSVLDCCTDEFDECKHCPLDKTCIAGKGFKRIALEWLKQEAKP